jgi:hypothetical protein
VTNYPPPNFHYFANTRGDHAGRSQSDPTAADAATKLAPWAAQIVALFLSLGLWGAIWQAISSLVAAWPPQTVLNSRAENSIGDCFRY